MRHDVIVNTFILIDDYWVTYVIKIDNNIVSNVNIKYRSILAP